MRKALGSLEFALAGAEERGGRRVVTAQDAATGAAPRKPALRQERRRALRLHLRAAKEHPRLRPGRRGALPGAHPCGRRYALRLPAAAGDRRRGRGPCVPAGHRRHEGLCGQRFAAGPAGGKVAAGRGGDPAGHRAQEQFRARRHPGRVGRRGGRKRRPGAARFAEQALRRRGRRRQGPALSLSARLRKPLGSRSSICRRICAAAHYYEYGPNKTEQAAKAYWDKIKGAGRGET